MWRFPLLVVLVLLIGCQPTPRLEPDRQWWLEFGRGSGSDGLDTVKANQNGEVLLHRMRKTPDKRGGVLYYPWETATLTLLPEAIVEVTKTINDNRLWELDKTYRENIADGTQWVLWIRQDGREKVVYFDNRFPDPIVQFAKRLDEIIAAADANLKWQRVPDQEVRKHERELWDSIKR